MPPELAGFWRADVPGAEAMVRSDDLLVVGTPSAMVFFDAMSGEQRWRVDVPDELPGEDELATEHDGVTMGTGWSAVMEDQLPMEASVLGLDGPPSADDGGHGQMAVVMGYQLANCGGRFSATSPLGAQWVVTTPAPFYAEPLLVTEGCWAWVVLADSRLYGLDFEHPGVAAHLDALQREPRARYEAAEVDLRSLHLRRTSGPSADR